MSVAGFQPNFQPSFQLGAGFRIGNPRYLVNRCSRRFTVSSTSYLEFAPLDPAEKVELTFDFEPDLPAGVLISGAPIITIRVVTGVDATPANILNDGAAADISQTQMIVPVKGGLDGTKYAIKVVQATTDPDLLLALTGVLPMMEGA